MEHPGLSSISNRPDGLRGSGVDGGLGGGGGFGFCPFANLPAQYRIYKGRNVSYAQGMQCSHGRHPYLSVAHLAC